MSLNCNTCKKRHDALAEGHCTEFSLVPQLNSCAMYCKDEVAPTPATEVKEVPSYLWLNQTHDSSESIKPR